MDLLAYPIIKYTNHGSKFYYKGKAQEIIRDFYRALSCLILVSSSEALPRTILEAMACGLPVISTNVGSLPLLISPEWLISVNPEELVIKEMNEKLKILETNTILCKEVGEKNRNIILKNWSWRILQPYWDLIFTELYKNHMLSIKIYDQNCRAKFNHLSLS